MDDADVLKGRYGQQVAPNQEDIKYEDYNNDGKLMQVIYNCSAFLFQNFLMVCKIVYITNNST